MGCFPIFSGSLSERKVERERRRFPLTHHNRHFGKGFVRRQNGVVCFELRRENFLRYRFLFDQR